MFVYVKTNGKLFQMTKTTEKGNRYFISIVLLLKRFTAQEKSHFIVHFICISLHQVLMVSIYVSFK